MRVLILPDSFKGTLSAEEAANAIAEGICEVDPSIRCELLPMADGGEGSSAVVGHYLGAESRNCMVLGPEGQQVEVCYYHTADTAFIELAAASGFSLSRTPQQTALSASTFGLGQLIDDALHRGLSEIRLFLGGSATSDAGAGMAYALGAEFYDAKGLALRAQEQETLGFDARLLSTLSAVDLTPLRTKLASARIIAAVDVENPLYGTNGAAHVYGPQKGLTPPEVKQRDADFMRFARLLDADTLARTPGAGAAGGAGFGVLALLSGTLLPGASFFLDTFSIEQRMQDCDLLITGEGKTDSQSLQGKLLGTLAQRCKRANRPLWCLCGSLAFDEEIPSAFSEVHFAQITDPEGMQRAYHCLRALAANEMRQFLKNGSKNCR